MLAAAPQLASAQTSASLSGLFACEALTDSDAELACFRAETAKLRGTRASTVPKVTETQSPVQKIAPEQNDDPEKFIPIQKDETPKKRCVHAVAVCPYV